MQQEISIYLNTLVDNYRHGGPGSAEALLEAFEPIRGKYYKLLTTGIFEPKDRDVAHFLKMLGNGDPHATARSLAHAVEVTLGYEDLSQELTLCILETAQRYSNISANYKYVAKERMKVLLRETIYYENSNPDDMERVGQYDAEELDETWIDGSAASEPFQELTEEQRLIVKTIYVDGFNTVEAAKILDIPLGKLRRLEQEARRILADTLGNPDWGPTPKSKTTKEIGNPACPTTLDM